MKTRKEIPQSFTWNLQALYPNHEDWEKDLHLIMSLVEEIVALKGTLTGSAAHLLDGLTKMDEMGIKLEWAYGYARMSLDVDMGDSEAKKNYERIDNAYAKISDQLAFYEPELLTLNPEKFNRYKQEEPKLEVYSFMFEKLFQQKEHILSQQEEEIMARMGSLGNSFKKIYDDITVNDLEFPEIEGAPGEKIKANETQYRKILTSYDRDLRARYFKGLLGAYGSHINSLTSTTNGNVKHQVFTAKTRKYESSRQMALKGNHVPEEVYDNLIQTVRSNVHLLQRYIDYRQKKLGFNDIHFYDLFVPLVEDADKSYTYEEARDTVLEALSVLGNDYTSTLKEAFSSRWIDVYPNKGKISGAYANGIFGLHPYSLLNFTGTQEDVFTMAHD